jgi:hypothetical protein
MPIWFALIGARCAAHTDIGGSVSDLLIFSAQGGRFSQARWPRVRRFRPVPLPEQAREHASQSRQSFVAELEIR